MISQTKKLKNEELFMLFQILEKSSFDKEKILDLESASGYTADIKLVDRVLDCLSDELSTRGIQQNGEPNMYGLQIDNLITFYSNLSIELKK